MPLIEPGQGGLNQIDSLYARGADVWAPRTGIWIGLDGVGLCRALGPDPNGTGTMQTSASRGRGSFNSDAGTLEFWNLA